MAKIIANIDTFQETDDGTWAYLTLLINDSTIRSTTGGSQLSTEILLTNATSTSEYGPLIAAGVVSYLADTSQTGLGSSVIIAPTDVAVSDHGTSFPTAFLPAGWFGNHDPNAGSSANGEYNLPLGIAISTDASHVGYLGVCDSSSKVQILSPAGSYTTSFTLGFSATYSLSWSADATTSLFVSNNANLVRVDTAFTSASITALSTTGMGSFGGRGCVFNPTTHYLYYVDNVNHRIRIYNTTPHFANNNLVTTFGTTGSSGGQLTNPTGIACDRDGNIYVINQNLTRIDKFNPSGSPSGSTLSYERSITISGASNLQGIGVWQGATTDDDLLLVGDNTNKVIYALTKKGAYIQTIGPGGGPMAMVSTGTQIATATVTPWVFMANTGTHRFNAWLPTTDLGSTVINSVTVDENSTWAVPNTSTEYPNHKSRNVVDLTNAVMVRITTSINNAGTSGSDLELKYSDLVDPTSSDFSTVSVNSVPVSECLLNNTGAYSSLWLPVDDSLKHETTLAIFGKNGGANNVTFSTLNIQVAYAAGSGPPGPAGPAGPSGTGDFTSTVSSSVDGDLVVFSGTTGKQARRSTGLSGLLKASSGNVSTATSGSDYAPATSGSAALKGNGAGGFNTATLNDVGAATADYSLNSHKLTSVVDPASAQDAATKNYVDGAVGLLDWKQSVRVATTATGTLTTAFANGQTVDGVTLVTGDRILLKDQSTGSQNGIYVVAVSGSPTRATDADSTTDLTTGAMVYIETGTVNATSIWTLTTTGVITIGTTSLVFARHVHNAADITAGTISTARLGSGSASSSTFLRGDQTWSAIDATNITTGTMATARLGSGSASSSTFLRGDQTWATVTASGITFSTSTNTLSIAHATSGSVTATCAAGFTVVGGGCDWSTSGNQNTVTYRDFPSGGPPANAWTCTGINNQGAGSLVLEVYAICIQ